MLRSTTKSIGRGRQKPNGESQLLFRKATSKITERLGIIEFKFEIIRIFNNQRDSLIDEGSTVIRVSRSWRKSIFANPKQGLVLIYIAGEVRNICTGKSFYALPNKAR